MSRALIALLLGAALTGCVAQGTTPQPVAPVVEIRGQSTHNWLLLQEQVSDMGADLAAEELKSLPQPEDADSLYYYGLLKHEGQSSNSWILARDTFAKLVNDASLEDGQRQLAEIMRDFNQTRINYHLRIRDMVKQSAQLQQQLRRTKEEKRLLEERIQALTELETDISTRREE